MKVHSDCKDESNEENCEKIQMFIDIDSKEWTLVDNEFYSNSRQATI